MTEPRAAVASMTVPEADAFPTGPGGFFELGREAVGGREMDVVTKRGLTRPQFRGR